VKLAPTLAMLLALSGALEARADEVADLLQGTNLTFALAPNGATLVATFQHHDDGDDNDDDGHHDDGVGGSDPDCAGQ